MTRSKRFLDAIRFFAAHAGGVVGESAKTAYHLALAEAAADRLGWMVEWQQERDPDLSWCDECDKAERSNKRSEHRIEHAENTLCAYLKNEEGVTLTALGNIDQPDRNDRRVIEAELALGQLSERELRGGFAGSKGRVTQRMALPHGGCEEAGRCIEPVPKRERCR